MGMRWEDPQTVRLQIRPELINAGGLLSGVVTYALVNYCMGSTLWVQTTAEERIATISISINYIQTATDGEIVCRTVLDRRNRTNAVLRIKVRHENGRLLVTAIGSYTIFRNGLAPRPDARSVPLDQMAADSRAAQTSAGDQLTRTPVALTIAGSDSGGGAGIQADLKAFARCGVHGASAITALTAQNTVGVSAVHTIPPDFVLEQVRAVVRDIGVDAVKVGMLGTAEIAHAVARALDELPPGTPVVVDPVMVAESGARLLDPDAQGALVAQILPRATVLTPNLLEARVLAGVEPAGAPAERDGKRDCAVEGAGESDSPVEGPSERDGEAEALARAVLALGPGSVVLTGGHRSPRRRSIRDPLVRRRPERRRRARGGARRRAPVRRRCARLRLHALLGARRTAGARADPAGSRAGCAQARGRGRGARPARRRCRRRSGGRARSGGPPRRGIIGRR